MGVMQNLIVFLKGLLMGISDIIPGVSGGTIALIVGVYDRLIRALGNINLRWVTPGLGWVSRRRMRDKRVAIREFMRMDPLFLGVLGLGIGCALLAGSYAMPFLLGRFPAQTYSVFIGLILMSAVMIGAGHRKELKGRHLVTFIAGLSIAWGMVGIQASLASHSVPVIFLSGFLALTAMLLPGVSGSFVLVMLGQYAFVLSSLHAPLANSVILVTFAIGAAAGILITSRVIAYLLSRYHGWVLSFLIGLMVGSLNLLGTRVAEALPADTTSLVAAVQIGLPSVAGMGVVAALHSLSKK